MRGVNRRHYQLTPFVHLTALAADTILHVSTHITNAGYDNIFHVGVPLLSGVLHIRTASGGNGTSVAQESTPVS